MAAPSSPAYDPTDPAFRADPYPFYARLRRDDPAHRTDAGAWLFTRYDDCLALLNDARSSSDPTTARGASGGGEAPEGLLAMRPFLLHDPPEHTRLRSLVSKAFTPKVVQALRPRVQQLIDGLLDAAAERGSLDIVDDLAYPLPVTVICELLGVPPEDHVVFRRWSSDLARGQDPPDVVPADVLARSVRAMTWFVDYFRELASQRRKAPRDDLLSALIAVREAGEQLSEDELLATCVFLLGAGHETTVNLIANGTLALLRHPDQLARLRSDAGLTPRAVEELLRYDAPVQLAFRIAREDMEVRGVTVRRGARMIVALGAANRDPERFAEPDRLDVDRRDNHHLAFGHGVHFCLGAPLARLEGELAFRTLLDRFAGLELATDAPAYHEAVVLRGLRSLPVRFGAASGRRT